MALHDELTDLPNRHLFGVEVEKHFAWTDIGHKFAVLCLDLDHFKNVNDTFGHPFGDKLLKQVGVRLRSFVRQSDAVARFGGDEFAILQGNMGARAENGRAGGQDRGRHEPPVRYRRPSGRDRREHRRRLCAD